MKIDQEKLLQTNIRLRNIMQRDFVKPKQFSKRPNRYFPSRCTKCKKYFATEVLFEGKICKSCYKKHEEELQNEDNPESTKKNNRKI